MHDSFPNHGFCHKLGITFLKLHQFLHLWSQWGKFWWKLFKIQSPLKMMKNDFLFHVKSSFCCKGNQTMKFGQLIEFNKRNIFLKISYTKFVRETIPRPFFNQCADHLSLLFIKLCKKYFWHILLTDQISQLDCLYFLKYLVICML